MSKLKEMTAGGDDQLLDPSSHGFSLREHFGKNWKIQMEESWGSETAEGKERQKPWYETVPTRCKGFISLFQDKPTVVLMFYTPSQRITCRKLAEKFKDTPGVRLDDWFDGHEAVLYFPVELFGQVAEAVGARRKRQGRPLTDAQRAAFAEGRKKGMAALKRGRDSLLSSPP